jgi:drug/metabolite transporter (DMT)-like permease
MSNLKTRGIAEMSAAMTISGTIGLFVILSEQPLFNVVFWRCTFGAVALLLICWAMGLFRPHVITRRQLGLAAIGGMALVINWLFLFAAYSRASISIATAVYNTHPFMLVALGAVVFSERLTLTKFFWLVVAFIGMLALLLAQPEAGPGGESYLPGILLALGSAFFYTVAAIITKRLTGVPPHLVALIQVSVGIIGLAPLADFGGLPGEASGWAFLVTLGIVHTGLMYILLYGAIQKLPTNLTASLSFIYPVIAILVDFIAFDVRLHPLQFAGASAILIAAAGSSLGWKVPFGMRVEQRETRLEKR